MRILSLQLSLTDSRREEPEA